MFLVNSRPSRFHDTKTQAVKLYAAAHHLPKLRSYFAEFLRYHYPNRLSIRCQPTCVGFRYGGFAYLISCVSSPTEIVLVDHSVLLETRDDKLYTHRFKFSFFYYSPRQGGSTPSLSCSELLKLSKRPYHLLKDYLNISKTGGSDDSVLHTVIRYLYQHWRNCSNWHLLSHDEMFNSSLFYYKWNNFHFVVSVCWMSSVTLSMHNI